MNDFQKGITRVIGVIFLVHSFQWIISFLADSNFPNGITLLLFPAGTSLITGILLLTKPKNGVVVAIIRSLIGVFFAVYFGQFFNISLLNRPDLNFNDGFMAFWPSIFFLATIILFGLFTRNINKWD